MGHVRVIIVSGLYPDTRIEEARYCVDVCTSKASYSYVVFNGYVATVWRRPAIRSETLRNDLDGSTSTTL